MLIFMLASLVGNPPQTETVWEKQIDGRTYRVLSPIRSSDVDPVPLTAEAAEEMSSEELARLLLGGEAAKVESTDVRRGQDGRLREVRLALAAAPDDDGHCVRTTWSIQFEASNEPPTLHHRFPVHWLQRGSACDEDGPWTYLNPGLDLERGTRLFDDLRDLQRRIGEGAPRAAISCRDDSKTDRCAGDIEAKFASLDLDAIRMMDPPGKDGFYRAHLPIEGTGYGWDLRFFPRRDTNDELIIRYRLPPPF